MLVTQISCTFCYILSGKRYCRTCKWYGIWRSILTTGQGLAHLALSPSFYITFRLPHNPVPLHHHLALSRDRGTQVPLKTFLWSLHKYFSLVESIFLQNLPEALLSIDFVWKLNTLREPSEWACRNVKHKHIGRLLPGDKIRCNPN